MLLIEDNLHSYIHLPVSAKGTDYFKKSTTIEL